MALSQMKTMRNGAEGNYWKITSYSYDRASAKVVIQIACFKDKAHADAKASITSKSITLAMTKEEMAANPVAAMYTKIKADAATVITTDVMGHVTAPHPKDADLSEAQDA